LVIGEHEEGVEPVWESVAQPHLRRERQSRRQRRKQQMTALLMTRKLTMQTLAALPGTPPLICMYIVPTVRFTARSGLSKGSAKLAKVDIVLTLVSLILSSNGSSELLGLEVVRS
jgi:hypothetical protein